MKPIYILGDVHGLFEKLINIVKSNEIRDSIIICVGDLGIGFSDHYKTLKQCEYLDKFFRGKNIHFYSIRGNHDAPSYFKGDKRIVLPNFELIQDYTVKEINDQKFLFVGGATSIDRINRRPNSSWWEDEVFNLEMSAIERCDVLITHSAPTWNGPSDKEGISYWCDRDPSLWDECLKERKEHDILIKLTGTKHHYAGHFHQYYNVDFDGCRSIILEELQIYEHR